jgi:osmotically-inducible protein OsmY
VTKLWRLTCGLLWLSLLFPGAAAQTKKAAPASDAEIKQCIEERFAKATSLAGQAINVAVSNGEATLSGTVKAGTQKGTATRIAKAKSCGAKNVANNLSVEAAGGNGGKKAAAKKP